ncbi:ABC transporter permease [Bacillaceae bacterium Marseille-Q3522]|nr:ABC transporter permease [Bacillaceae bacterium Marseille-Q3522]
MNFIKRALLSLKARKGKSLLQIFIFTVICVFVISGLAIQSAADTSASMARKSLGGDVTLQLDMEKMMGQANSSGGRIRMQREPIPLSYAEELSSYPHVKGYNILSSAMAVADSFSPLESEEEQEDGNDANGMMGGRMAAMGDISLQGVLNSDSAEDFIDSVSSIVDGRHLTENDLDAHVTIIEKNLAEENNLKVGDKVTIKSPSEETSLEMEIIGIYETTATVDDMFMSFSALNPYNRLYVPYTAANELKGADYVDTMDSAIFYMDDPANIESFVSEAKEKSSIDFEKFTLDANDSLYQQMIGPIENVASFSKNVVYLVTVAGAIILGLIVMMSIRERKYEMGVLMALGEKKAKLIGQFIAEILIVAIISLGISTVSGNTVANLVGNQLLEQQLQVEETNQTPASFMRPGMLMRNNQANQQADPIEDLNIHVTGEDFTILAGIGLLIALLSTLLPALLVLRLQPKMILTKQD